MQWACFRFATGRFREDTDLFDSASIRSGLSDEDDDSFLDRLAGLSEQPAFERELVGLAEDAGSLTDGGGVGSEDRESIVIPPADKLVRSCFVLSRCSVSFCA